MTPAESSCARQSWRRKDGRPYLRRSFFRTPRGGRVTILGRVYEPGREPLPERLWNVRALFHLYVGPDGYTGQCALWGSEEQARASFDVYEKMGPGPFCEGGFFKWEWWRVAEAEPSSTHGATPPTRDGVR